MRDDVVEIVRAIKGGSSVPYTILVSNWSLMTDAKYLMLRDAGVGQFSVSLDFPGDRHDEFRRTGVAVLHAVPALSARWEQTHDRGVHPLRPLRRVLRPIRSYMDKSFPQLLRENVARFFCADV